MIPRITRLKDTLDKEGIDSMILCHPANISYLTGFQTEESLLFVNKKGCLLITDFRYLSEYIKLLKNNEIQIIEADKSFLPTLIKVIKKYKVKNLAFEQDYISFSQYQKLKSIFSKKLIPTEEVVEEMRTVKDAREIKLIKKAISITLDTFKFIKRILKPGMSELELSAEIERYIRLKGANQTSFDMIVASGPNSSFPHAKRTNRIITENEPLLVDLGVDYKGYKSDLTRVFFLGKMSILFKRVYETVKAAQQKAKSLIQPGAPIDQIDKRVRRFIAKKGFGKCFRHSLGHGVGMEVHELPKINSRNTKILKQGMIFTLEPAIYIENKFGVRIEEMMLVTSNGAEVLSDS